MRIPRLAFLLFITLSVFAMMGCGSEQIALSNFKGTAKVYYPDWWQSQPNADFVCTYGMSIKVSENMSRDAAYSDAMLQSAQYVEATVQGMMKNYEEESSLKDSHLLDVASKVVKIVSRAKFDKPKITKQETVITDDKRYKAFIQVSIPRDAVDRELVNNIRNEEALYNHLKISQAFQALEKQVDKQTNQ